jgi:hypothetical protein
MEKISPFYGAVEHTGTGDMDALQDAARAANAANQARAAQQPEQSAQAVLSIDEQVKELANHVMVFGARAVAAAEEALASDSTEVAAQKGAEATQLLRGAVQILQRAAELGLDGPAGDAAAMVVERAMTVVEEAQADLSQRITQPRLVPTAETTEPSGPIPLAEGAAGPTASPPRPSSAPIPGTPAEQRMGVTQ